jgi:hypothetical protein
VCLQYMLHVFCDTLIYEITIRLRSVSILTGLQIQKSENRIWIPGTDTDLKARIAKNDS